MKTEKKKVLLVFIVLFAVLLFQHHFMWLYHDDYGYASLSYVGDINKNEPQGYHTSELNILKFCKYHYENWGGRVLYFFIECNIMHFGIHGYRIIQSIAITLIFYMIYKIIAYITKKESYKLAMFIASLYGAFEIMVVRDGIFWFTASILYIFPLLPFLVFIYNYVLKEKNDKIKDIVIGSILVLLASFSQEQISAMVVGFIGLYVFFKTIKNKRFDLKDIPIIIAALIGFGLLALCPGSSVRMTMTPDFYNLSIIDKLKITIPTVIESNFGTYTKYFTLLFFGAVSYMSYDNYKNNKYKKLHIVNIISIISTIFILIISLIRNEGYFSYIHYLSGNKIYLILVYLLIFIQFALVFYSVIMYLNRKKQIHLIELFIAGIATQVVMLIAPYFPLRSSMIMQFIYFVIIGYVAYEIIKNKGFILLIPLMICFIFNFALITCGYYLNDSNNKYNHELLLETSKKIKAGEKIDTVHLKKARNDLYSSNMPYHEGYDYIDIYIKAYYELPEDIVFIYE